MLEEPAPPVLLQGNEQTKDAANLGFLWEELQRRDLDRGSLFVLVGGGTLLDVGMFLAATWLRGVDAFVVPTTLLAQVDAGLGGKCGVNLGGVKNQVGVVKQPQAILVDPACLATLPADAWQSGLGEVAKTALLAGGPLLDAVEELGGAPAGDPGWDAVVSGCLSYKARVVEEDEHEAGRRAILNLGHTVAHVLEGLVAAVGREIPHGLAVAAGMAAEARAFCEPAVAACVAGVLKGLGLPAKVDAPFDAELAERVLSGDKKRRGRETLVPLLEAPGAVTLRPVASGPLLDAVRLAIS